MLTKKYPSTTRIVGIVLRSYIPNSGEETFARHMKELAMAGARLIGGCCGTTPGYIRKMKQLLCK